MTMTVREFKELINAIGKEYDNCLVVSPIKTDLPGFFMFEGVCPAVTEIITVGKSPDYIKGNPINRDEQVDVLLVAPHSFHENDLDEGHKEGNKELLN